MLVTVENLNIEFNDDVNKLKSLIEEYKKLEKAIEDSAHYKLLVGKTQTLGKNKGITKKERSRLVHTNMVAHIASEIVRNIYNSIEKEIPTFSKNGELNEVFELNRELAIIKTRCIGKAHDIGHEAFGHTGERAKNSFYKRLTPNEIITILNKHRKIFGEDYEIEQGHGNDVNSYVRNGGGISFEHNESSALIFNEIINENNINLPEEDIRNCILGVLAHSTSRVSNFDLIDGNLPAQAVRIADKIEYRNEDYDELKDLFVDPINPPINELFLKMSLKERIKVMVGRIVEEAKFNGRVWEKNKDHKGRTPVMIDLGKFRKDYESSIFRFDSLYSKRLLREELFPIISDDDKLLDFYKNNPGVEVWYPKWKVQQLYENEEYLKRKAENGELPDEKDEEKSKWNSMNIPSFRSVLQGENQERMHCIYKNVLQYYYDNSDKIPEECEIHIIPIDYVEDKDITYKINPNYSKIEKVLTYISLFDDAALIEKYLELVEERIQKGPDYGIEPVTASEMQDFISDAYERSIDEFACENKLKSRTLEEQKSKYTEEANKFYLQGLSKKGKKAYEDFYKQRFEEFDIDKKLYERMLEADKERGEECFDWNKYYGIEEDFDDYEIEYTYEEENALTEPITNEDYISDSFSHIDDLGTIALESDFFDEVDLNPEKVKRFLFLLAARGIVKIKENEEQIGEKSENSTNNKQNEKGEKDNHSNHDEYGE